MCTSRNTSAYVVSPSMGDGDSSSSDCESRISDSCQSEAVENALIKINDGENIHDCIKTKLLSSLSSCGFNDARVEAIHKVDYSGIMKQAKIQCFWIYSKAMEIKCGGNGNVKWAWYGASKNEIRGILSHGFNLPAHGHGLVLSPVDHLINSLRASEADKDGVRRLLLCRVILGKMEEAINPCSEEHDSGVDNLVSPHKYIIWNSRINTHILPEFVVAFQTSSHSKGSGRCLPKSDWMPIASLIAALSRVLPADAVKLIARYHSDFRRKKITRREMVEKVRQIAGDKLLKSIIKIHTSANKGKLNK